MGRCKSWWPRTTGITPMLLLSVLWCTKLGCDRFLFEHTVFACQLPFNQFPYTFVTRGIEWTHHKQRFRLDTVTPHYKRTKIYLSFSSNWILALSSAPLNKKIHVLRLKLLMMFLQFLTSGCTFFIVPWISSAFFFFSLRFLMKFYAAFLSPFWLHNKILALPLENIPVMGRMWTSAPHEYHMLHDVKLKTR
jgi:hypothetical protein